MNPTHVMFFKLGHKLLAIALSRDRVVAKQYADSGLWFENAPSQPQVDGQMFCRLPVAEMNREFVNFK